MSSFLFEVEKEITYEKFIDWMRLGRMKGEKVEVFFPRFELENYEMNNVVCRLGMTDAFEEGKADFSGIFSKQGFFLSNIIHKAFVEVNEEGTEADASTAIVMKVSSRFTPCFCAEHPFLFFIQHVNTSGILFCGRFSSP